MVEISTWASGSRGHLTPEPARSRRARTRRVGAHLDQLRITRLGGAAARRRWPPMRRRHQGGCPCPFPRSVTVTVTLFWPAADTPSVSVTLAAIENAPALSNETLVAI